jgi:predicted transcriptional regulator
MNRQGDLSRRERQIMDIIFESGEASVNEIQERLPDPPTHTAVRTLLSILEAKGHLQRRKRGRENLYSPRVTRQKAGQSALRRVVRTFFEGSLDKALGAYLSGGSSRPSEEKLKRAAELIKKARKQGG